MRIPSHIYQNAQVAPLAERTGDTKRSDPQKRADVPDAAKADVTVALSTEALVLANENVNDAQKVERLRASLAAGEFTISADAIAASIVETGG